MKGVQVYHTITVLSSRDYSIREIAEALDISKTTVLKYLKNYDSKVSKHDFFVNRVSEYDQYRNFLIEQMSLFPSIRITKLYIKLKSKYPNLKGERRSFHNYVSKLRFFVKRHPKRYYEPIETLPGLQIQVDPGEQIVKFFDGSEKKIYFVSFVFSFSRMKYVYLQDYPFDTLSFIKAHKEAFEYFGYITDEFVYDQTKLVVITEKYREVWLNERFHQFANDFGFMPYVCEGYDPESKGKVERVVQEVKKDFLYGDYFLSLHDIRSKSLDWLEKVNNTIHSTTQQKPVVLFDEEVKYCKKNLSVKDQKQKRLVDKTGLISFEGNKYSVPEEYQQSYVFVRRSKELLIISEITTNNKIAEHLIALSKGKVIKNTNHYRNYKDKLSDQLNKLKDETKTISGFDNIIKKVISNNPKIVRDQIRGLRKMVKIYGIELIQKSISYINSQFDITVSKIENILKQEMAKNKIDSISNKNNTSNHKISKSTLDRDLKYYDKVVL